MKKIEPYNNKKEATQSLDNGGRFFNFGTKADDHVINTSELRKISGYFDSQQQMVLFLEMSLSKLEQSEKVAIIEKLDANLTETYQKFRAQELIPSEAITNGILSSNAILTGIPKLVDSKSDFEGFIMFPMIAGSITTIMMIPLIEQYDVYELRDEQSSESFIIAHLKDSEKLPNKKIVIGGMFKELNLKSDENQVQGKFLEADYYMEHP